MNSQETKQWLADMYQQSANGGDLQRLTGEGIWVSTLSGPGMGSEPNHWRIKPEPRVIDMSALIGTGLLCEFWDDSSRQECLGRLTHKSKTEFYPYCLDAGAHYQHCQPLMSPYIHFWKGGDTCPVLEGFDVRLHTRGKDLGGREPHFQHYQNHTDIIGIEFIGIKEGYTLGGK
jgi:hypothetical protein